MKNNKEIVYLRYGLDGPKLLLKVGHTGNPKQRDKGYTKGSSFNTLISYFEGDVVDEKAVHLYFNDYLYKNSNNEILSKEAFFYKEEIFTGFENVKKDINIAYKYIWENREYLFLYKDLYYISKGKYTISTEGMTMRRAIERFGDNKFWDSKRYIDKKIKNQLFVFNNENV